MVAVRPVAVWATGGGVTRESRLGSGQPLSAPFMNVEQGFLLRTGATIATASAVDVAGVRVGVLEESSLDALLSQTLKNATIIRARTLAEN